MFVEISGLLNKRKLASSLCGFSLPPPKTLCSQMNLCFIFSFFCFFFLLSFKSSSYKSQHLLSNPGNVSIWLRNYFGYFHTVYKLYLLSIHDFIKTDLHFLPCWWHEWLSKTIRIITSKLTYMCAHVCMGGKVIRDKEPQTEGEECDLCGSDLLSSWSQHTINHYLLTSILMAKQCFSPDERCTAKRTEGKQQWHDESSEEICVIALRCFLSFKVFLRNKLVLRRRFI